MTAPIGPGSEVMGYRLDRLLGRGGMGTVYLAHQIGMGRQVALKLLHAAKVADGQATAAFLAEAQLAGRLHHPNLVVVHDLVVDAVQGLYGYVMEYVPGETLSAMVRSEGTLTRTSALEIVRQVASALAEAHRHGFVHRDIKPDNILITPAGQAKLLDLGLATNRLAGLGSSSLNQGHRRLVIVGTPEYMAPEQGRNPENSSSASDIWSLGATLVFLMTGKPPFDGSTIIDLLVRAATEPLTLPADFPADLTALLAAMLAKNPSARPVNGQELLAVLHQLEMGNYPGITPMPTPISLKSEPAPGAVAHVTKPADRLKRRPLVRRRPR